MESEIVKSEEGTGYSALCRRVVYQLAGGKPKVPVGLLGLVLIDSGQSVPGFPPFAPG
jgi:hypothetical protein